MTTLTHRERLEACLSGGALDRPPVALWRHFPVDDQTPDSLAAAVVHFQRSYDFDFVKVTPSSSFCLQDWGVRDEWRGDTEGVRSYTQFPIREPQDWERLKPLDPRSGWLGGQIASLHKIIAALGPDVPVIQTIFNPLSQAKNMVGRDTLIVHLRRYPDAVLAGLRTIAETSQRFIEEARKTGIAGVFYAVQHAQYGLLSEQEYTTFGRAMDLQVLEAIHGCWLNVLHLHGDEVMFHLFQDYPLQVINWHDQETSPSLAEAQKTWKGAVCGGLRQWQTIVMGSPQEVQVEAHAAIQQTAGKRFILGTGCVTPITAPHGNLMAVRNSVEKKA
jgi:uroporphyrinogen decarboxylase